MKERPIILKAHEVRGILGGRQTQLRRIVKPSRWEHENAEYGVSFGACPFGQVGNRLWGRETFSTTIIPEREVYKATSKGAALLMKLSGFRPDEFLPAKDHVYYKTSHDITAGGVWKDYPPTGKWKPSTQMPRWASRILLEIVSVRVERYSAMTDDDAYACGVQSVNASNDVESYEYADKVSMRGPKQAYLLSEKNESAWCWVIEFKRVDA